MKRSIDVDKVGAIASAICAVHCLLTGIALGLLSVVGLGFIGSPTTEAIFIGVAVIVGIWAIVHGIRKHGSYIPSAIFVFGLICIAASHFAFPHSHDSTSGSTLFSILGGLSLVTFHIVNLKLQKRCDCGHCALSE